MMDDSMDFIQWLGEDLSLKIFMCLEDPSDLVRTSVVSSSWRQFVIANGFCKKLCLRMFPEASSFARIIEVKNSLEPVPTAIDDSAEWACLKREHKAYASLTRSLATFNRENCILGAIFASSTDNYPEESIENTLEPSDRFSNRASYWSSKGTSNPAVPEALIYKLASQLCLITEVHVHPFRAFFQFDFPIYSAKAVRFLTGHPKVPWEGESEDGEVIRVVQNCIDDYITWTYCSPEFPMAQENCLQKFKLPEPVLCIGGILKVELLGRVQTQETDGLYYVCITHVKVVGRPLSPVFDVEMIDEKGKCALKCAPENFFNLSPAEVLESESSSLSQFQRPSERTGTWEQMILNRFQGAGPLMIDDPDSDSDYEFRDL